MNFEVEKAKIKQLFSSDVYDLLKENGCILAGGAVTSIFTGAEINDFDVYFTNSEAVDEVVSNIYGMSNDGLLCGFDLIATHVTDRSLMVKDKHTKANIQFIHYKLFNNTEDLFKAFDFVACMGAYDFAKEEFVFHEGFFKDLASRTLTFNQTTDFPIISALRTDKYIKKGFSISKPQMLRILFTIANKKYDSWASVISECGGMYGIASGQLFDTTKKFSIEELVEQLSSVSLLENPCYTERHYNISEVVPTMFSAFSQNFRDWWIDLGPDGDKYYQATIKNYDSGIKYGTPVCQPAKLLRHFLLKGT